MCLLSFPLPHVSSQCFSLSLLVRLPRRLDKLALTHPRGWICASVMTWGFAADLEVCPLHSTVSRHHVNLTSGSPGPHKEMSVVELRNYLQKEQGVAFHPAWEWKTRGQWRLFSISEANAVGGFDSGEILSMPHMGRVGWLGSTGVKPWFVT